MASKSFNLADAPEGGGGKGPCGKLCIYTCVIAFVGILGAVAVYIYQTTYGNVCGAPELDENGLSNWTTSGAEHIAYACFPDYFLETGSSNLAVGKCEEGLWNPLPPSCNSLPLRIDCQINNQSMTGNITMWQHSADAPTHIHGRINYTSAVKPQGHLMEYVLMSKRTCNISHVTPIDPSELHPHPEPKPKLNKKDNTTDDKDKDEDKDEDKNNDGSSEEDDDKEPTFSEGKILKIHFNTTQLKAYKKAEIFMNIIFVDSKTTATLVSVHQENLTLVMTGSDPVHSLNSSWSWDKEKKTRGLVFKR